MTVEERNLARPPHAVRHARLAVVLVFFLNGAVFASWVPRIPEVKSALGLGDAELGAALLGPALGAITAMAATGAIVSRHGSRPVTRAVFVAFCALIALVGLAPSWIALFLALTVWGAAMGSLDVAMNSAGMTVQRGYGRSIMSGLHASFSAGTLAGAVLGSLAAQHAVDVAAHLIATGAIAMVIGVAATLALLPAAYDARAEGPALARPTRPLMLLSALAFAALLAEGAAADWSAVYLRDDLGAAPGVAGAGFVAFAIAMTLGRLAGDRLLTALGPVRMVRGLAGFAAAGFALALLAGDLPIAIAGLALLGLGLACVVPVVFTAAAQVTGTPGPAIAAVSTCGYLGFIAGPPSIGLVAEGIGLTGALGIVAALVAVLAIAAGAVRPATTAGSRDHDLAPPGGRTSRAPERRPSPSSRV